MWFFNPYDLGRFNMNADELLIHLKFTKFTKNVIISEENY